MIKKLVQSILSQFSLELRKINSFPNYIELENDERILINKIINNNLSMTSTERLISTLIAVKYVCNSNIRGDFVECGVWRGGNSIVALHALNKLNSNKKLWMFDTFAGMTEPTQYDFDNHTGLKAINEYKSKISEDHNEWCYASIEDVKSNIKEYQKQIDIKFVKGDILKTLRTDANIPKSISVLRLDTDWYESTKLELEILYPKLQKGGVLLIDDYGHWGGCKKAVDEYFLNSINKPILIPSDYTGRIAIKI